MRGKMRFWSKSSKHAEKKLSREKQASVNEVAEVHGKKVFARSRLATESALQFTLEMLTF